MRIAGTGIDLVETARIRGLIERHGERFLARVFTPDEISYCSRMKEPWLCYAARFAAKEAASKALGCGIGEDCAFLDLELRRLDSGAPVLAVTGTAAATAGRLGITEWHVSLSHTAEHAIAQVIACAP